MSHNNSTSDRQDNQSRTHGQNPGTLREQKLEIARVNKISKELNGRNI
ncbi:hypothetical protein [Rickettsiales endosymbiont of Stachyamoeba lipophora]|nr:hypothetical protein [Rickettsiales endosymbiont of Stachyamoeba lipophora]